MMSPRSACQTSPSSAVTRLAGASVEQLNVTIAKSIVFTVVSAGVRCVVRVHFAQNALMADTSIITTPGSMIMISVLPDVGANASAQSVEVVRRI